MINEDEIATLMDKDTLRNAANAEVLRDGDVIFAAKVLTQAGSVFVKYNPYSSGQIALLKTNPILLGILKAPELYWRGDGWSAWEYISGRPVDMVQAADIMNVFQWLEDVQGAALGDASQVPVFSPEHFMKFIGFLSGVEMRWLADTDEGSYYMESFLRLAEMESQIFTQDFFNAQMVFSHGDVHPLNFIIDSNDNLFSLDLGSIGIRPTYYDWANFIESANYGRDLPMFMYAQKRNADNAQMGTLMLYRLVFIAKQVHMLVCNGSFSACFRWLDEYLRIADAVLVTKG